MFRDFTLEMYENLCQSLINNNFVSTTVVEYLQNASESSKKRVVLRHDVDKLPNNALRMGNLEHKLDMKSTFYFRVSTFNEDIVTKLHALGHEIGYHYEVLAKNNGDKKKAIGQFKLELDKFRKIVPIETICMHGSPLSRWKDSDLWDKYKLEDYQIKGEAFLSLDYQRINYFTDTGRSWAGQNYNVRDEVEGGESFPKIKYTPDLINFLPDFKKDISINTHPQRWNSSNIRWLMELLGQNLKNIGKRYILKRNRS